MRELTKNHDSTEICFSAEAETKLKLEKVAEIKRNNAIVTAIKSDISKHEEQLKVPSTNLLKISAYFLICFCSNNFYAS